MAVADVTAGVAAYQQRNFTEALNEFQESAKRDDVRALNYLGIMYAEGMGTPRNDTIAVTMFSKAALLGFPEAMANMGRMHAEGRGVPQDNNAAVAAFRAAARRGFQPAITRMAMIYERGELGVAPDAAQAGEWRAQLSASPVQSVPVTNVAMPGAIPPVAETPPEPVETPDMVALAHAARKQLQVPQTPSADTAPPEAATPTPESIAPEIIAPAAVVPQPAPEPEPEPQILATTPAPVAVRTPEIIAAATPTGSNQEQPTQTADTAPPAAPAIKNNVIASIAVTLQSGEILIRVQTQKPLAAPPAYFEVTTPPRIVFDFPHTVTGLGRYHEVGEGDLQSVDVISGDSRTRMVLILRKEMQHVTKMDSDNLLIILTPIVRNNSLQQ